RLHLDRRRPVLARPAARPQRLVAARGVRLVPVDPFPAALLAEGRLELLMAPVHRRDPQGPACQLLLTRVLDVVVLRERLVRAGERIRLASVLTAEAAQVERPDVPLGSAVDDPLAHRLPDSACTGEPVRTPARGDPEARDVGLAE